MFQSCCTTSYRTCAFNSSMSTDNYSEIRSRHLSVSSCNQQVEYEASHHFRGCSPGLADGDVITMETSLEWPHTLTLLTQVIAHGQLSMPLLYTGMVSYTCATQQCQCSKHKL